MELTIAVISTIVLTLPAMERLFLAKEEPDVSRRKRLVVYAVVIGALALNISLNWIQYANVKIAALNQQKMLERELAFSLWAYSNGEEPALKYLTSKGKASTNSYLLGYWYLRKGNVILAKQKFQEAIGRGEFVAPSEYFLALMEEKQAEDQRQVEYHLGRAKVYLKTGVDYDPKYSSLFVSRAIIHAMQHETQAALDDIETAVNLSPVHCYTVIRNGPDPHHPLNSLYNEPRFKDLLTVCNAYERDDLNEVPGAN